MQRGAIHYARCQCNWTRNVIADTPPPTQPAFTPCTQPVSCYSFED